MRRSDQFLMLVQTEGIVWDIKGEHDGCMAVTILAQAMKVDPACLPENLERATWEFIDHILTNGDAPAWLRYSKKETDGS